jgi:hypothetical protein
VARSGIVVVVVLLAVLAGCANSVTGIAHSDPRVVAQLAQERNCQSAVDELVTTITTLTQRVDSGTLADFQDLAFMDAVPVTELGQNLGRQCGRELIGSAYSQILNRVNALTPATILGRAALQAVLSGLCSNLDPAVIPLDTQARLVCAGR